MWTAPVASMPYGFQLGQVIGRPGRKLGGGGDWGQGVYSLPIPPPHPRLPSCQVAGWLALPPKATAQSSCPLYPALSIQVPVASLGVRSH